MDSFGHRVEKEIPQLRRYARRLTRNVDKANDLVQDTLLRALIKSHLWEEGTNLRPWLFTILHNIHVNSARKAQREGIAVSVSDTEPSLTRAADQDKRLELRDLDRALGQLPEEQRTAILLIGLEDMPYEAAADTMGVPVGTIRSRISRGREALRIKMAGKENGWSTPTSAHQQALRRPYIAAPKMLVLPALRAALQSHPLLLSTERAPLSEVIRTLCGIRYTLKQQRLIRAPWSDFRVRTFSLHH